MYDEGMWALKVKAISLPYILQVMYVLCFTRPRYQVSVYRTIGPLVLTMTTRRIKLCQQRLISLGLIPTLRKQAYIYRGYSNVFVEYGFYFTE